jgi:hypothetical protein
LRAAFATPSAALQFPVRYLRLLIPRSSSTASLVAAPRDEKTKSHEEQPPTDPQATLAARPDLFYPDRASIIGGSLRMSSQSQGENFEPKRKAVTAWVVAALSAAAAIWVGWMLGWPRVFDFDEPDFNPMLIIEGLLLAVCLWHVGKALLCACRAKAFGASEIEGRTPVPLRGDFQGRVRTARPIQARGAFRLVLTCLGVHELRNARSSSASPYRNGACPVWSAEQRLPATTDSARGQCFRHTLPASVADKPVAPMKQKRSPCLSGSISINIPGLQRIFTRNKPAMSRCWTRVVTARTDGPDCRVEFTLPLADH